ncbi:MAG TPA: CARDB domain-containing protein [Candidatus Binatia bacterium]|jgi:pectate lyase|nr:CARDB domain-containing protein [Candidatus Binatia bacterium]
MFTQRLFVSTSFALFSPQLSLLAKLGRRAVWCYVLIGALVCPRQAVAADYSSPDYYVSANVTPYYATTAVTIEYSASNLSDVAAPATTVTFSMVAADDSSPAWDLGQSDVPAIDPWQDVTQTVTFPLPAGLPVGTTDMRLIANINPTGDNGEVATDNNVDNSGFGTEIADSAAPSDPPAPSGQSLADLAVTSLDAPASAAAGSAISISDAIKNASSEDAGEFTISYDLDGPAGKTTLANRTVSGLPAGGSSLESFKVTIPSTLAPATYTLTVQVNSSAGVTESDSGNNTATRSLTVTAAAVTSTPTSASPSPAGDPSSSAPSPTVEVDTALVGFGTSTPGGTGQPVYTVTTLAASGPGSLAEAVSQGNRYITFAVAGTITLTDPIETKGPFLTIDGFSAPTPGITLSGAGLYMMGASSEWGFDNHSHDIIVRGLRIRDPFEDAFRIAYNAYNIVLDHVSAQGAGDGNIDVTEDSHDVTVSWSIFADPASQRNSLLAYRAWHISMHHNLFIGSEDRDPFMAYDYEGTASSNLNLEFWNNLVWDWGGGSGTRIAHGSKANVVNNYFYSPGDDGDNTDALIVCQPQSPTFPAENEGDCENYDPTFFARAYVAGNVDPAPLGRDLNAVGTETSAFPGEPVTTQDACAAATDVLTEAGAVPLDSTDRSYLSSITLQADLCP